MHAMIKPRAHSSAYVLDAEAIAQAPASPRRLFR
jgi:hypothetical protein